MSEPQGTAELVVRNGKRRGTRVPVPLPLAIIGAAETADVRVSGAGIADTHCVLAATPAGPVLRSFVPDRTLVNGNPTAGTALKDGDEIQVGPCLFQLSWPAAEPAPVAPTTDPDAVPVSPDEFDALRAQAAAVVAQQAMLADAEGQVRDREDVLAEQEAQLAGVFGDREDRIVALQSGLAGGRELLRADRERFAAHVTAERAKLKAIKARIAPLHAKAKQDRKRARALYQRFSDHLRKRWLTQRQTIEREWAELERFRREVSAEGDRVTAERAKAEADAAASQYRIAEAWEMVREGQRRLVADRQQADAGVAARESAVTARETQLASREETLDAARVRVEGRVSDLLDEVARLETRANRARAVLHDLEEKRASLEAGFAAAADPRLGAFPDVVPLDRKADGGIDRLLADLHQRERDIARERLAIASARAEVERRATGIADDRLVLAEQVAALSVARDRWQDAERQSLAELESLARSVQARELFLASRERELETAEARFRRRQDDLDAYRGRLDGWQASLAAHEATAAADRDKLGAELTARRQHLARWEAALGTLCRKWAAARKRDRDALAAELERWTAAREALGAKLADADRVRDQLLADVSRVAEQSLALAQAGHDAHAPKDAAGRALSARRVRVLRKKWEAHFARLRRDADARRAALAVEVAAADARFAALHRTLAEVADQRAELAATEQTREVDRLVRERELDERASVMDAVTTRSKRTEAALAAIRDEVERVAAALMTAEPPALPPADAVPPGVIALRPATVAA